VHRAKTGSFLLRLTCLVAASVGLMAQAQPSVQNAGAGSEDDKGFISRVEFGGSANTLGQEFILNGSAGYQFNPHAAVPFAAYSRALIASHLYGGKILAWQCSVCGKIFSRTVDEIERECDVNWPAYIEREFRMHSCELVLVERQEKQKAPKIALFVHRE
jgi:hypothetical protein